MGGRERMCKKVGDGEVKRVDGERGLKESE